jgi:hypothetical protein
MKAEDVTDTLNLALDRLGLRPAPGLSHQPRLLSTMVRATSRPISPNGSTTRACSTRAARPTIPQTQGKIERWHQTLKNRILLENYYLPATSKRRSPLRRPLQSSALPREPEQPDARRRLLRPRANHPA